MTRKDIAGYLSGDVSFGKEKGNKPAEPSLTAIRLKRSRLAANAKSIVTFAASRTRFCTATFRFSEELKIKKHVQDRLKYLFKKLKRAGCELEYSGMLERHMGEKRKDKKGSMAFHFHFLAYRVGGRLWRGVPAWDYDKIQEIAVSLGGNIDMQELSGRDVDRKISGYMSKLDAVCVAAYQLKRQTGEDYCYTMTSKGCYRPQKKLDFDPHNAWEFIQDKGFEKKDGGGFPYYKTVNKKFSKNFYRLLEEEKSR
jgi:hypothetical protein